MKFPNHIILEYQPNSSIDAFPYWTHSYLLDEQNVFFQYELLLKSQHLIYRDFRFWTSTKYRLQKKFTIIYNDTKHPLDMKNKEYEFFKHLFYRQLKVKNRLVWANRSKRWIFDKTFVDPKILRLNKFVHLLREALFKETNLPFKNGKIWHLFNVNFIRKEKLYTKLKYSRTPQYDMVSGGSAAILSGFLGFLVCEKFGFELLDAGDFYICFMYAVFAGFFFRLFLKLWNGEKDEWFIWSYKWLYTYYVSIFTLILNFFKIFFRLII